MISTQNEDATQERTPEAASPWNPKILVFACNWCSYAGADTAGVSRMEHAPHFRMIRVMCSGRVQPGFILRAFENGADGVLVTGCHPGDCHYVSGNQNARKQFEKTKSILQMLGLEPERLRLEWISAAEGARFAAVINEFTEQTRALGPSLVQRQKPQQNGPVARLIDLTKSARGWACYDCGKCTGVCPIVRAGDAFSPRRNVLATRTDRWEQIAKKGALFHCLTCGLCDLRCPAQVNYTLLVRALREKHHQEGAEPQCPHGGTLQSLMRLMARGEVKQQRLKWLDESLKTESKTGQVFFWTGCAMYYDALFSDLGVSTLASTRSAIQVLNRLGIAPVVSPDERCCGHDLIWNGDRENFEALARRNVELVSGSGAEVLVTPCAECVRTWKLDYEAFWKGKPLRIVHFTEFIAERLPDLKFKADGLRRVTFHDPCRLGRHLGAYEPPRKVLAALPGVTLAEMPRSGKRSICCAGTTWSNCDRFAKKIQVERLKEARSTGADALVTACPKCQIHLRCAMKDPLRKEEIEMELLDVAQLLAQALAEDLPGQTTNNPRKT